MPSFYLKPETILKNRYRIEKAIGQGGFGIIYEATDLQLGHRIAIKEFFSHRLMERNAGSEQVRIYEDESVQSETRQLISRFLSEARCMAKLGSQETIPNVYDFFEANNTAYMVMELLEGQNLRQHMAGSKQPLPLDLALFITERVGEALTVLHKAGIIHRDISPDNIFLCDAITIQVKTLDLGAALLKDSSDKALSTVLKVGYSPIEQYESSESRIGPWTDVYALGATLYFMLTGIKPEESTIRKKQDSLKAPHLIRPDIPLPISRAVMKALAIEPEDRFKTAGAFLDALKGKKKVPTTAVQKLILRLPALAILLLVLTLATAGALYLRSSYLKEKRHQELEATSISVWICADPDSGKREAMEQIIADFQEQYPHISVNLTSFPSSSYHGTLEVCARTDQLPDLFESSVVSTKVSEEIAEDIFAHCIDLSSVLEESPYKADCLFLEDYPSAYPDAKQFPLGIEIPMAYVLNNSEISSPYSETVFSDLADFEADKFQADPQCESLLLANFDSLSEASVTFDSKGFLSSGSIEAPVFLSSSLYLPALKEKLIIYETSFIPYQADEIACRYTYEWSITASDEGRENASLRLLSWMLSENYQDVLMISGFEGGPLPLNKTCFMNKADLLGLPVLKELYPHFVFGRWQSE